MAYIAVLHHDLEWSEPQIAAQLLQAGHRVSMHDVRATAAGALAHAEVVLNRVYASVANRDFEALQRALDLVNAASESGARCINGYRCTVADYDKHQAGIMMAEAGLTVPRTALIDMDDRADTVAQLIRFAEDTGFPIIVKRNSSGRAEGIRRLNHEKDIASAAAMICDRSPDRPYRGRWIAQALVRSATGFNFRCGILGGVMSQCFLRPLVRRSDEDAEPWFSNYSQGTPTQPCELREDVAALVRAAAGAIEADLDILDIAVGETGLVVIENNPTPSYVPEIPSEVGEFVEAIERTIAAEGK